MARYRLSAPAQADIVAVLRTSEAMHGTDARIRYRGLLTAAMRRIAAPPEGRSTVDCGTLFEGMRSFHIRHSRHDSREARVAEPAHLIFCRMAEPGVVEILRVLHEKMEPRRHLGGDI